MLGAHGVQDRVSDPLEIEMELQMVVVCHVHTGIVAGVLCQSCQYS